MPKQFPRKILLASSVVCVSLLGVNLWLQLILIFNLIHILPILGIIHDIMEDFCVEATKGHVGTLRSSVLLAVRGIVITDCDEVGKNGYHSYDGISVVPGNQRELVVQHLSRAGRMKKSDASKIPSLKPGAKKPVAKSPSLPKRQLSPDPALNKTRSGSTGTGSTGHLVQGEETPQPITRSIEDIEKDEDSGARENGSGSSDILDEVDASGSEDVKTKAAIEHIQEKISRIMGQIKNEQVQKEANVNEYLQLAGEADKVQLLRIKQVFERKNQKSTANLSQLQKKLENYSKKLKDVETYGVHNKSSKDAKDVLQNVGQGLKDVGANIREGISGFSGGVVDNIKGAKETIVSKPREFAHLIKNKFGSADNINTFKGSEDGHAEDGDRGGTLPARELGGLSGHSDDAKAQSFKYTGSEEDASSITSGSGLGVGTSPQNSHNTSQQILIPQAIFDHLVKEIQETKEASLKLQETLQRVTEEFESYKIASQQEVSGLRGALDEDKFRMERTEEQMNDITELNQHEVTNLKQAIASMEEKADYRLEELVADLHEQLDHCQTRVQKMELKQEQQQLISMEMVENVTFRTILTKLINVVLAILAVILVFVSTSANLISPFLTSRARILSTAILIVCIVISWNNWQHITDCFIQIWNYIRYLLPNR